MLGGRVGTEILFGIENGWGERMIGDGSWN